MFTLDVSKEFGENTQTYSYEEFNDLIEALLGMDIVEDLYGITFEVTDSRIKFWFTPASSFSSHPSDNVDTMFFEMDAYFSMEDLGYLNQLMGALRFRMKEYADLPK